MTSNDFKADPQLAGLVRLGYTDREAAFLRLAALHSGYFTRRQYLQFVGKSAGGTAAALIEKAVAHDHVKVCTYVSPLHLYHLCSRSFYAALGQGDNRHRRDRQPLTIKAKLMGLDFVLEHPTHQYFAGEQDKVSYFVSVLKVHPDALPAKRYCAENGRQSTVRFFVDKFPMYTAGLPNGDLSEVGFCYIDAGATTVSGFETYLTRYRPLFSALPGFQVVYAATRPLLFDAAERFFQRFVRQDHYPIAPADVTVPARLRPYFETRFLYERADWASFDRDRLIRLRDQRQALSTPETETLYARWRTHRERAATLPAEREQVAPVPLRGAFSACLLEHNYDLFGNLTAF
jgi:hypothetical protein